mgnify:FL=1
MKIEKKTFYNFVNDNDEGFKRLQEFSKTIKRENFINLIKDSNNRMGFDKWDLLYWTDEE